MIKHAVSTATMSGEAITIATSRDEGRSVLITNLTVKFSHRNHQLFIRAEEGFIPQTAPPLIAPRVIIRYFLVEAVAVIRGPGVEAV